MRRARLIVQVVLLLAAADAMAAGEACHAIFASTPVGQTFVRGDAQHASRVALKHSDQSYAFVDFLDRGIVQVATSLQAAPAITRPTFHTPMIAPADPKIARQFPSVALDASGRSVTPDANVKITQTDFCVEIADRSGQRLARIKPIDMANAWKGIEIETDATHAYGLGEYPRGVHTDEPWLGWVARTSGEHGNIMSPFYGGVQTYTQFPIAYGTHEDGTAFGVFVDTPYKVEWDFTTPGKWHLHTWGDELRYYVFTGKDLREVHQKYLSLVGHAPLPPRGVFENGISKFGYRNWADVDHDISEMKAHGLPTGMINLDLYWFGGDFITNPQGGQQFTKMGSLTPDAQNFPNFAEKIADLKSHGTDVTLISESYVNLNLPEAQKLLEWGCVVKDEHGSPIVFENRWWGTGYMIDWTHPKSKEWIKLKYVPLAKMGIRNYWFDLGEPEAGLYAPNGRYFGIEPGKNNHGDIHNVYNLMWVKRFKQVMDVEMPNERFYMMNRSGTSGLNRFGAGKWGGDTGMSVLQAPQGSGLNRGDIPELIAHLQNRIKNMPLVGIDYYTSDVGGFHRWALNGDQQMRDLGYTVWYANGALLDMPFRPHLWVKNGESNYLPTQTGHVPSNVANTRQRVELEPYYYQAAVRASVTGTPIVAPLVYRHPKDPNVREMGHEAYIGEVLLMGIVGNVYEDKRNVYLPEGGWYDYHTNQYYASSAGRWIYDVPLKSGGNLTLPVYAREGAILPLNRLNADGSRIGSDVELRLRVFASDRTTQTPIVEDDGSSRDYESGLFRKTLVRQAKTARGTEITVFASEGSFKGAASVRAQRIELVTPAHVIQVAMNGHAVREVSSEQELAGSTPAVYFDRAHNVAIVYAPSAAPQTTVYSFQN